MKFELADEKPGMDKAEMKRRLEEANNLGIGTFETGVYSRPWEKSAVPLFNRLKETVRTLRKLDDRPMDPVRDKLFEAFDQLIFPENFTRKEAEQARSSWDVTLTYFSAVDGWRRDVVDRYLKEFGGKWPHDEGAEDSGF